MTATDLLRLAIERGWCCSASLGAEMGVAPSTVRCWMASHRAPPADLLLQLLRHLTPLQRRELIEQLAHDVGAAPAAEVIDLAHARQLAEARRLAGELLEVLSVRRAA